MWIPLDRSSLFLRRQDSSDIQMITSRVFSIENTHQILIGKPTVYGKTKPQSLHTWDNTIKYHASLTCQFIMPSLQTFPALLILRREPTGEWWLPFWKDKPSISFTFAEGRIHPIVIKPNKGPFQYKDRLSSCTYYHHMVKTVVGTPSIHNGNFYNGKKVLYIETTQTIFSACSIT